MTIEQKIARKKYHQLGIHERLMYHTIRFMYFAIKNDNREAQRQLRFALSALRELNEFNLWYHKLG